MKRQGSVSFLGSAPLFGICATLLVSGCAWGPCGPGVILPWVVLQDKKEEKAFQARYDAARRAPVPLPASTPYDATPEARAAYLEAYHDGYQSGLLAFGSGHDGGKYEYPQQGVAYYAERVAGWEAGNKAGLSAPVITVDPKQPNQSSQPMPLARHG